MIFKQSKKQTAQYAKEIARRNKRIEKTEELKIWRSFFGSLLEIKYTRALASILDFVSTRYALSSLAWLERKNNHLEVISTFGGLQNEQFQIRLPATTAALSKRSAAKLRSN